MYNKHDSNYFFYFLSAHRYERRLLTPLPCLSGLDNIIGANEPG